MWRVIAKELQISGLENVTARITSVEGQIQTVCPDDNTFRTIKAFLSKNKDKISFHTTALPSKKSLRVVIKGISQDIPEGEIIQKLKNISYKTNFVKQLTKQGKMFSVFLISLSNRTLAKVIYQLTGIFYVSVKIESFIQGFGLEILCLSAIRLLFLWCIHLSQCVKCGGIHLTRECAKPKEVKAKYCKCGDKHIANYRSCLYYTQVVKKKKKNEKSRKKPTEN